MTPPANQKRQRAAPVGKSEEVIERILAAVGDGTPLAEVCREKWAPHAATFNNWVNDDPSLERRLALARVAGHDQIAARVRQITRGGRGSTKDVKRDRLVVETDLKLLAVWDRRYRPAQVLAGDPEAPLFPGSMQNMDPGETLAAMLVVVLARKERAKREGIGDPPTAEQLDYLSRMHPLPAPIPHRGYRGANWQPPRLLSPPDGSDLA